MSSKGEPSHRYNHLTNSKMLNNQQWAAAIEIVEQKFIKGSLREIILKLKKLNLTSGVSIWGTAKIRKNLSNRSYQ